MKKIFCLVLVLTMIFSYLVPMGVALAEGLDEGALELFLDKLTSMDEDRRSLGASVLKEYLKDGDNGINNLKKDLNSLVTAGEKEALERYGYTLDDVKRELDRLLKWSQDDRLSLVEYIKDGNTAQLKGLIVKYEEGNDSNPGDISSGSSSTVSGGTNTGNNKVEEEKLLEVNFKDIDKYKEKEDIIFLAQRGIIEGKAKEKFDPNGDLTRSEFMTLISKVLGLKPADDKPLPFKDVDKKAWYYVAVKTAYDNKITDGTTSTTFSPNDKVTREQMVTIVMRILNEKGITFSLNDSGKDVEMFIDKDKISSWAITHMFYGVKYGIIEGRTATTLAPKDWSMRAEAASIIRKLYDALKK